MGQTIQDLKAWDSRSLDTELRDRWAMSVPAPSPKPPISSAAAEFGARVRAKRNELGLSQEALADQCELHWTYIRQVERGQRNISLHNILRLAVVLDADAGELVTGLRP